MVEPRLPADLTRGDAFTQYLITVLDEHPFDWRACNCCHFVQGWIEQQRALRVRVGGVKQELRSLRGRSIAAVISERLGCRPRPMALARLGDPVLKHLPRGRWVMGVCAGTHVAFRLLDGGVYYEAPSACAFSWSLDEVRA
jgi:hypothetical protein